MAKGRVGRGGVRRQKAANFVLAGDIGGTNARLRLYDDGGAKVVHEATMPSASEPTLEAIVSKYLAKRKVNVRAAALAVAGPVVDGVAHISNLPWVLDEKALSREIGIPIVRLFNDLEAAAIGCTRVGRSDTVTLARGKPVREGNKAVIAAGTGLGEALLVWEGDHFVPQPTEGGHADFASSSPIEDELLSYLRFKLSPHHVSYERVLSGPGLGNLYDFFAAQLGEAPANQRRIGQKDRNRAITLLGLSRKSRPAAKAVDLFARIYGAEAGNLVLKGLTTGGLFLCGRMAAEILPRKKVAFLSAMRAKGRMSDLLTRIPVILVTDSFVGLTGAGYLAARLASS
jgi:glucokinase